MHWVVQVLLSMKKGNSCVKKKIYMYIPGICNKNGIQVASVLVFLRLFSQKGLATLTDVNLTYSFISSFYLECYKTKYMYQGVVT